MLCSATTWPFEMKLADFGFAALVPDGSGLPNQSSIDANRDSHLTSFVGTPYYLSPETLSSAGHGRPVDLWATGVCLYVIMSGKFPFGGDSEKEYYSRVLHKPVYFPAAEWKDVSPAAKSLIRGLLSKDPVNRLTACQALDHEWFRIAIESSGDSISPPEAVLLSKVVGQTPATAFLPTATAAEKLVSVLPLSHTPRQQQILPTASPPIPPSQTSRRRLVLRRPFTTHQNASTASSNPLTALFIGNSTSNHESSNGGSGSKNNLNIGKSVISTDSSLQNQQLSSTSLSGSKRKLIVSGRSTAKNFTSSSAAMAAVATAAAASAANFCAPSFAASTTAVDQSSSFPSRRNFADQSCSFSSRHNLADQSSSFPSRPNLAEVFPDAAGRMASSPAVSDDGAILPRGSPLVSPRVSPAKRRPSHAAPAVMPLSQSASRTASTPEMSLSSTVRAASCTTTADDSSIALLRVRGDEGMSASTPNLPSPAKSASASASSSATLIASTAADRPEKHTFLEAANTRFVASGTIVASMTQERQGDPIAADLIDASDSSKKSIDDFFATPSPISSPVIRAEPFAASGGKVRRRGSGIRQLLSHGRLSLDSRMPPSPEPGAGQDQSPCQQPNHCLHQIHEQQQQQQIPKVLSDTAHAHLGGGVGMRRGRGVVRESNEYEAIPVRKKSNFGIGGGRTGGTGEAKLSRFHFRSFHRPPSMDQSRPRTPGFLSTSATEHKGNGRLPPKVAREQLRQESRRVSKRPSWHIFSKLRRSKGHQHVPPIPVPQPQHHQQQYLMHQDQQQSHNVQVPQPQTALREASFSRIDEDEGSTKSLIGGSGGGAKGTAPTSRSLFTSLGAPLQQAWGLESLNSGELGNQGTAVDTNDSSSRLLTSSHRQSNRPLTPVEVMPNGSPGDIASHTTQFSHNSALTSPAAQPLAMELEDDCQSAPQQQKPVIPPLSLAASPAAVGWTTRPGHADHNLGACEIRMISHLHLDID
jgi:serine/threonine protein kinase